MDLEKLLKSMTNITPNQEQIGRIENLRASYKDVANSLFRYCKESRESLIAITKLEESLMWAVKGMILERRNECYIKI